MQQDFYLTFIKQKDFEEHVFNTIKEYKDTLKSIDLAKFNANVIDPIKLCFDKNIFNLPYEKIIQKEIERQRDKSNNNSIGYFHQNIFKYIKNCEVPKNGWDVIVCKNDVNYYIEMKNKHNTMNSAASSKTYMRMQSTLLSEPNCICALVEVIAKVSSDKEWVITLDGEKQSFNPRLRRISIDKFYHLVTDDNLAFKKLCLQLPITLKALLHSEDITPKDSVLEELQALHPNMLFALYKLAFGSYDGFENLNIESV
ncbi:Eco47II family restriction endonuclease [Helicobacter pylori]